MMRPVQKDRLFHEASFEAHSGHVYELMCIDIISLFANDKVELMLETRMISFNLAGKNLADTRGGYSGISRVFS